MWAAYRKGLVLPEIPGALAAEPFKHSFEAMVLENYDAAWTLFAEANGKYQPVGLVVGFYPHHKSETMIIEGVWWFQWATPRNRVESAVDFFSNIRREIPFMGFAEQDARPFFDVMCKHGILRRVGTSYNAMMDKPAAIYESRWEQ